MIRWIKDLESGEEDAVGWKASNLSKVESSNVNVPKGFVIKSEAFERFKEYHGINEDIISELNSVEGFESSQKASQNIKNILSSRDIPEEILEEIKERYSEVNVSQKVREAGRKAINLIGNQRTYETVLIRISPVNKSEKDIYEPEVGVSSKKSLEESIKKLWEKYFEPEAIFYRSRKGIKSAKIAMIVQKSIETDESGSVYTRSPFNRDLLEMESAYGLGVGIRNGDITPDRFLVERNTGKVVKKDIAEKYQKYARNPATGKIGKQSVSSSEKDRRSLSTEKFSKVVNECLRIEKKFNNPVRVDFGLKKDKIHVFGVTELEKVRKFSQDNKESEKIVEGIPIGDKTVRGVTKVFYSNGSDIEGKIVVTNSAEKRLVSLLEKNEGLVTETGARSTYISTICDEIGFPALIRTKNVLDKVEDGEKVVLDCSTGSLYSEKEFEGRNNIESLGEFNSSAVASKIFKKSEKITRSSIYGEELINTENGYQKLVYDINDVENDEYLLLTDLQEVFYIKKVSNVLIDLESFLNLRMDQYALEEVINHVLKGAENVSVLIENDVSTSILVEMIGKGVNEFIIGERMNKKLFVEKLMKAEKRFIIEKLREIE